MIDGNINEWYELRRYYDDPNCVIDGTDCEVAIYWAIQFEKEIERLRAELLHDPNHAQGCRYNFSATRIKK